MSNPTEATAQESSAVAVPAPVRWPAIGARLVNLWGTPRRFFMTKFRRGAVSQSIAMRRGECNRCGACCQLVVKCVFLRFDNGLAACGRYETRPSNCSEFPISQACIDEVNRIAPNTPCGYSFLPPCHSENVQNKTLMDL